MAADNTESIIMAPMASFTKTWHQKPYPFISPTRPELSATGQNVVVTGGGTGIGKAVAKAFAQAGASSVSILGRRLDRLQTSAADISAVSQGKTRVLLETADLSKRDAVDAALKSITDKVGQIDIFVSNAGMLPQMAPVKGYDLDEFRRGLELNVIGAFNAVQGFLTHAAPGAKLFNISSGIGHIAPLKGCWNYALDKAALVKMFDFVADENPDLHVVNVQPGVVATEINDGSKFVSEDERTSLLLPVDLFNFNPADISP
jgi:NAD(P)-dependent dehydrogenase (short-subunit alcohol dehydrogenase family)